MKLRRLALLILVSQFFDASLVQPSRAQPSSEMQVYIEITDWFGRLIESVNQLASLVDKHRLVSYATNLGNSFEAMIKDKREIALLLKQTPVNNSEVEFVASRLELNVKLAKQRLSAVSLQLKLQDEIKGSQLANDLSAVFFERKGWMTELRERIRRGSTAGFVELAEKAEVSAKALDQANTQLTKFITAIRRS